MTKGEMIESIYLNVVGGMPTDDVDVQKAEIAVYLAAAINYEMVADIRNRKREQAALGEWDTGVDTDFLGTIEEPVLYDDQRGLKYVKLNTRMQSLPGNGGLQDVYPTKGERNFVKMRGPFDAVGLDQVMTQQTLYWFENVGADQRVYFRNISPSVTTVIIRLITSIQDLDDDDQVPVPPGLEVAIIDRCVQFFTRQREMPDDELANNKDDKR